MSDFASVSWMMRFLERVANGHTGGVMGMGSIARTHLDILAFSPGSPVYCAVEGIPETLNTYWKNFLIIRNVPDDPYAVKVLT